MMKNKWKITAAAILGTAGILTAGYLYWCTTLDDKVIWKDVSINWVALQGKTIEAAEKAVQEQFKKDYQDSEITVSLAEKNYEVKIFPVLFSECFQRNQRSLQTRTRKMVCQRYGQD